MKPILFTILLLMNSFFAFQTNAQSVDRIFVNYILEDKFEDAFKMLDTNSHTNHHNSRDTCFNQFKNIREQLNGKELKYSIIDSFRRSNFIGITSSFIPQDSITQFGLDVRYILGSNKIFHFQFSDNEKWVNKFLKPRKKIDASNIIGPN